MKVGLRVVWLKATLCTYLVVATLGQAPAGQSAESLRAQLREIEAKQSQLQERARQLDEDLKPENIERALALTGSTKPEELREQRRRRLEKEKEAVRVEMDQLATSHARLEAAITTADAASYRQSALGPTPAPAPRTNESSAQNSSSSAPSFGLAQEPRRRNRSRRHRARRRSRAQNSSRH